jgi:hypothetical protein
MALPPTNCYIHSSNDHGSESRYWSLEDEGYFTTLTLVADTIPVTASLSGVGGSLVDVLPRSWGDTEGGALGFILG